jgi:hypothetical protein
LKLIQWLIGTIGLYTTNQMPVYNPALNYQTLRTQLYSDYEAMDTDAIIASALDIIM